MKDPRPTGIGPFDTIDLDEDALRSHRCGDGRVEASDRLRRQMMKRHAGDRTVDPTQPDQGVGIREIATMQLDAIRPGCEPFLRPRDHRPGDVDANEADPRIRLEQLRRLITPSDSEFEDPSVGIPFQLQPVDSIRAPRIPEPSIRRIPRPSTDARADHSKAT